MVMSQTPQVPVGVIRYVYGSKYTWASCLLPVYFQMMLENGNEVARLGVAKILWSYGAVSGLVCPLKHKTYKTGYFVPVYSHWTSCKYNIIMDSFCL